MSTTNQQRGKDEPVRHFSKTAQDKTPPHLRQRVIDAQRRRDAQRGVITPPIDPNDDTPIEETR